MPSSYIMTFVIFLTILSPVFVPVYHAVLDVFENFIAPAVARVRPQVGALAPAV
jgi:hypothetical protein